MLVVQVERTVRCRPEESLPVPSPKVVQQLRLTPGERVNITNAPLPQNKTATDSPLFARASSARPWNAERP